MGSGVSRETASSPELEDFKECAALVTRGDCSWETLPNKMQAKMSGIVARLEEQAEPIFPQRGDLQAMYHLACLLADGKGIAKDEERAVSLWKAASERDHIPSRFMLGEMYYASRGIPVVKNGKPYYNEFRAVALWQSCSEKSFAPADRRLADAYRSGVGVIRADEAKAVEYYTRATNQCVAEAWSEIGELYEKGTGGASKMTIYQISYDKKSKQMLLTGIFIFMQFHRFQQRRIEGSITIPLRERTWCCRRTL